MEITFEVNTSTNFTYPGIKRKRLPGEPKLKPGPRPSKRPRKYQPRKAPTRLRKDRPLQTEISHDIWENILIFCPLDKLLKLRTLCKTFASTLASDRVWKQARIHQFGPKLPNPPEGMKELEYADLLVAVGCQNPECEEKCTRRTYWAFRRRWCEKCCVVNLIRERIAKDKIVNYEASKKCIPYAMYDSWNHYQWAGHYEDPPPWTGPYGAQTPAFSKFDIQRHNDKYEKFMEPGRTDDEIKEWFSDQEEANSKYMKQLQKIEAWMMEDMKQREKDRSEIRENRAAYFKQRASEMDPPLAASALELCPAFRKSADISKIPSEKSWRILREKLSQERKVAEAEDKKRTRTVYVQRYRTYLSTHYDLTVQKRRNLRAPEQRLVLRLADQVIYNLLIDSNGINDADIVNVLLRGVYDAFQRLTDEEKPNAGREPYRLIMDDALHVYENRILPLVKCFAGTERQKNIKRLFCPSAHCKGMLDEKFFEFKDLMEHLERAHSDIDGFNYLELNYSAPLIGPPQHSSLWYSLEWPRNLPMRATHQPPQNTWQIDEDQSYEYASKTGRPLIEDLTEALLEQHHFRSVRTRDSLRDIVLQATLVLDEIVINKRYKTSLALEILRTHLMPPNNVKIELQDVESLTSASRETETSNVLAAQCCVRCQQSGTCSIYAFQRYSFEQLVSHYIEDHLNDEPLITAAIPIPDRFKVENDSESEESPPASSCRRRQARGPDCNLPAIGEAFPDLERSLIASSSASHVFGSHRWDDILDTNDTD